MERLKANLLALLVAAHLLAITLQALPAPGGGMSRSTWKDPTVQAEFDAWRVRLNGWGWDGTTAQLEDQLWDFAKGFMERRDQVLTPFKPYYKHAGTTQAWRMFVAPHRYPARRRSSRGAGASTGSRAWRAPLSARSSRCRSASARRSSSRAPPTSSPR